MFTNLNFKMKKLFLILLLFFNSVISFSQNLIVNGDFENTAVGPVQLPWDGYNNQILIDDILTTKVGNVNNNAGSLFQVVNVTSGTTYHLTFDYRWVSGATNYNMTVNVKDGATGGSNIGSGFVLNTTPDVWHTGEYSFTVPTSVTQVRPIFWKADDNRPLRLDNVSVLEDGVSPPSLVDPETPANTQPYGISGDWTLDFSDEFNGDASDPLDPLKWIKSVSTSSRAPRHFQGIDDWWWREDHVSLNGVGQLELKSSKYDENTMYCGSVETRNLYEPQYGYFEARIEIANTQKGNHTAFWLQGHNMSNVDGTGNDGAEIDIFESAWVTNTTKAVVHIDGYGNDHQANTKPYNTPNLHTGYHIFGLLWNENTMEVYYDGVLKVSYTGIWVPQIPEWLWLSVGASFGDGEFNLQPIGDLSEAKVDWIRAYKPGGTLSVNEIKKNDDFTLYPNPTQNFLNIKTDKNNYSVVIYDQNGRVLSETNESKLATIDVSSFTTGVYHVKIHYDNNIKTHKLLIK